MVESVKANVGAISPLNLSGTVGFLKEFGRGEQAIELVRFYVDNRLEKPGFWDLRDHPFFGNITDPNVRDAFRREIRRECSPVGSRGNIKTSWRAGGWSRENLERLAVLTSRLLRHLQAIARF